MDPRHDQPEDVGGAFTWPPRQPVIRPASAKGRAVHDGPRDRLTTGTKRPQFEESPWVSFERAILGLRAGPIAQRAAAAGWRPDGVDDYCDQCGRSLEQGDRRDRGCRECDGERRAWERLVRLGEYQGELRRWIHELKYTRWRRIGLDLGEMLGESLVECWNLEEGARAGGVSPFIVAVPDAPLRRVWRGIDHAAVIATGVGRATGWQLVRPLRRRLGASQLSIPNSLRSTNAQRSFQARTDFDWKRLQGRVVVLVDDVVTSGSTMRACARLIAKSCQKASSGMGARIWVACLGRALVMDSGR